METMPPKVKAPGKGRDAVNGLLFKAATVIVICYMAETVIMLLLARFNLENSAIAPVLYSLAIILVMTPFIYLLFIKPAKRELEEKKALSASLEKTNRMLLTVSNCNQALVRATDGQQLMDDVCRILAETGGYRMAWIGIAENDAEKTVRPAAYGGHNEGYVETLDITWADTERGQNPVGIAIRTGKPAVVRKIADDAHFLSGGGGGG